MYIQARLFQNYNKPLIYKIPANWDINNLQGKVINVPLRNKKVLAFVEKLVDIPEPEFQVKEAFSIQEFPQDKFYLNFLQSLSSYYQIQTIDFLKRLKIFLGKKTKATQENYFYNQSNKVQNKIQLTDEQQPIVDFVSPKIEHQEYCPVLIHGVTGSGKSEVYKELIIKCIKENKSAIFLLPEVSLALRFENLFKQTLQDIEICSFHSAVLTSQKKMLWQSLINNRPVLIIGVHLPILLPISNLGLIIVDEEHEIGYQEKSHPKINSKEAAILKANLHQIPIILGSATPSITSLNNVKDKNWKFFQIKKRFLGSFAKTDVVLLNDKKQRKSFWISQKLETEIKKRLAKKEQTIIFINRRGYCFFVQCKLCNFIFKCDNCSVSLTLHKNNCLYCHYCGFNTNYPENCKSCKSDKENFLKKGIGTQQVITILKQMFPTAKIAQADLDTTSKKKEWNDTVESFNKGDIDILVGTQSISKGYHFPKVTLVGILWADLNLHFPIYNASEIVLQQILQVAGHAGREIPDSDVIVQIMQDHKIFNYLNEINYLQYCELELEQRKEALYPPFIKIAEVELKNKNEKMVINEAIQLTNFLIAHCQNHVQILGPVRPMVSKVKNVFTQKIFLKSKNIRNILNLYQKIEHANFKSKIYFTPNPLN